MFNQCNFQRFDIWDWNRRTRINLCEKNKNYILSSNNNNKQHIKLMIRKYPFMADFWRRYVLLYKKVTCTLKQGVGGGWESGHDYDLKLSHTLRFVPPLSLSIVYFNNGVCAQQIVLLYSVLLISVLVFPFIVFNSLCYFVILIVSNIGKVFTVNRLIRYAHALSFEIKCSFVMPWSWMLSFVWCGCVWVPNFLCFITSRSRRDIR